MISQRRTSLSEASGVSEEPLRPVSQRIEEIERVIEPSGVQAETQLRPLDPDVLIEAVEEADEVGQVQDQRAQRIRDSQTTYQDSFPELSGEVRTGPRGKRGQRGGLGFRVRNNTDRKLKKVEPGDVVNVLGGHAGNVIKLDTGAGTAGTRVGNVPFQKLIDDGSFLFEEGHRHQLGGHFESNPYGPPVEPALEAAGQELEEELADIPLTPPDVEPEVEPEEESPGLLQQGAQAVGGAAAGVAGAGARLAGGLAQGVGEGLFAQLPSAQEVGAGIGRAAVGAVSGAGRLAAGAIGGALEGEPEEEEEEP